MTRDNCHQARPVEADGLIGACKQGIDPRSRDGEEKIAQQARAGRKHHKIGRTGEHSTECLVAPDQPVIGAAHDERQHQKEEQSIQMRIIGEAAGDEPRPVEQNHGRRNRQ